MPLRWLRPRPLWEIVEHQLSLSPDSPHISRACIKQSLSTTYADRADVSAQNGEGEGGAWKNVFLEAHQHRAGNGARQGGHSGSMTSNNDSALHNMAGSQMREERAVSKSQILDDLSFEVFSGRAFGNGPCRCALEA